VSRRLSRLKAGRLSIQALAAVEQIECRCGKVPQRLLADSAAITQGKIDQLSPRRAAPRRAGLGWAGLEAYGPPPKESEDVTAETLRNRRSQRRHEPGAAKKYRGLMPSDAGKEAYRRRKLRAP